MGSSLIHASRWPDRQLHQASPNHLCNDEATHDRWGNQSYPPQEYRKSSKSMPIIVISASPLKDLSFVIYASPRIDLSFRPLVGQIDNSMGQIRRTTRQQGRMGGPKTTLRTDPMINHSSTAPMACPTKDHYPVSPHCSILSTCR